MFKKILIANRGENTVSPNGLLRAAQAGDFAALTQVIS